jgi:hypothetical protein
MTKPMQAGWYDDPHDPAAQRYWGGTDWTPYRQRKGAGTAPPPAVSAQPSTYAPPAEPPSYAPPPVVPAQPPSYAASAQPPYAAAVQPAAYGPGAQPPDSHLVMAVLSTFLCCFPFGIVAIINANKVSNLWALGQYDAAQAAADGARKWAIYSAIAWACTAGVALIVGVVFPVLFGLSLLGGAASTQP